MVQPAEIKLTTVKLWEGALLFAIVDTILVPLLVHQIKRDTFRDLRSSLLGTSGTFWCIIWLLMVLFFWEPVYHYVFPPWARWLIPPVYGILFILITLLFWWLSLRLPGRPTLSFCLLGGLWGMVTHLWGINRGLIEKPPMLMGVSHLSVALFPIFEFIFYWCVILAISLLFHHWRNLPR